MLKLILAHGGSVKTKEGNDALWKAAEGGNVVTVKILLAHGANPNAFRLTPYFDGKTRTETWSALQVAQVNRHEDVAKYSEVIRLLKAAGAQ